MAAYFTRVKREDDMIWTSPYDAVEVSGFQVAPAELEALLATHPTPRSSAGRTSAAARRRSRRWCPAGSSMRAS
jgi:hypothetical protein